MFGCSSLISYCLLSSIMLLMADSCHSCFACHLQTVHPIPVIFISISIEITSPFQWHTWFAKIMPDSSFSFRSMHMHCIPHLAYYAMFMWWLLTFVIRCLSVGLSVGPNRAACGAPLSGVALRTRYVQLLSGCRRIGRLCWTCFIAVEMSCSRDSETDRVFPGRRNILR